jgi:putative Ca2+/H+ antiporter (TMEM165/GDT1 family)
MHEIFTSFITIILAELGDKTQLLALILAARFKKPIPIILGIILATTFNHIFASYIGVWLASLISPQTLQWVLGCLFIGMAIWICIPDKMDEAELKVAKNLGIFVTTLITFFFAEMGDKTQIATIALAAHYKSPLLVSLGTTLGMLAADIPAVLIGSTFAHYIPIKLTRLIGALIFLVIGILVISSSPLL